MRAVKVFIRHENHYQLLRRIAESLGTDDLSLALGHVLNLAIINSEELNSSKVALDSESGIDNIVKF